MSMREVETYGVALQKLQFNQYPRERENSVESFQVDLNAEEVIVQSDED